jgi:DNA helicase-2/ATP-dependent DNA helicase PcrA
MDSKDILSDLTPAQREAVMHMEGPLLVLAGPGSGKTRVITRRVVHLLRSGVKPWNILAITFTNKAAGEMRKRVLDMVPNSKVTISTFHALGVRLLRKYADRLELDRSFTIYDQTDRNALVKAAIAQANVNDDRFPPDKVQAAISKAKNQLQNPADFARVASDFFDQTVARIYPLYERKLREANAVDFDDLLYWVAKMLLQFPDIREELDALFRYIMIDEYQDTNHVQYVIAKQLAKDYRNICVVGDPNQCLPPGTMVETPLGPRPIETLQEGERAISGIGWGKSSAMWIEKVMTRPYQGRLIKLHIEGGLVVRATPNHMCFALLQPDPDLHMVYLMWKEGMGYRLGTTRGVRAREAGVSIFGLKVRANQEFADASWIVRTCTTAAEARYYEQYLSVRYGIPTMVFHVRGRRMQMTQEWVDKLFREVDSETGALRLMADLCLDRRYPHHRPGGVTRGAWSRRHVLFTLFGDPRSYLSQPWHYHRIQMVTTGEEARVKAAAQFAVRDGSRGTWRIETSRKHHEDAWTLAQEIGSFHDTEVISRARLTEPTTYPFMPAAHIQPGMLVPVHVDGQIVDRKVEAVVWEEYEGPVYDLTISNTHNFVANGLVVHNSIYRFRGSDIRNILDFERDYPDAKVIGLGQNYRSTKSILRAAEGLISHNRQRKQLHLTTENPEGEPIQVLKFPNGYEEAEGIARRIKEMVRSGARKYRDFAIFLRINAMSRAFEQAMLQHQVPYKIVRGLAFFDRKENKDIVAYLRLLLNPKDDLSFRRAVNMPPRGVGAVSLAHLEKYASERGLSLLEAVDRIDTIDAIKGKAGKGLGEFGKLMAELRALADAPADEVIRQVLDKSSYRAMLRESKDIEDRERLENIEELITAAQQHEAEDGSKSLESFLEHVALVSDQDAYSEENDTVSIMTYHAAKGLEFPVVFMPAMENGILPHERSNNDPAEREEERRLTFVGITRAEEELFLTHADLREFRGSTLYAIPSPFLEELPQEGVQRPRKGVHAIAPSREARYDHSDPDIYPEYEERQKPKPKPAASKAAPAPKKPAIKTDAPLPPKNPEDFVIGALVRHRDYGLGKISETSGSGPAKKVRVKFPMDERTFVLDKAPLEVVKRN